MTRLVESDVRGLTARLGEVEDEIRVVTGLDFIGLAARARGLAEDVVRDALGNATARVVPITSGEGVIAGFTECVTAILDHVGCATSVTAQSDVAGFAEAFAGGATLVFAADDFRFLAVNAKRGWTADDDPCTALGYVAALDAASGGVAGKPVLLLGLGPVGRAAAGRLVELGANVFVCEPDESRLAAARASLPLEPVSLEDGLAHCWLVYDATPVPALIDERWVWSDCVVSAPGLPPAVTPEAADALGDHLIHEPLAIGVVTMAVCALATQSR